jgi:hypothetical protein
MDVPRGHARSGEDIRILSFASSAFWSDECVTPDYAGND